MQNSSRIVIWPVILCIYFHAVCVNISAAVNFEDIYNVKNYNEIGMMKNAYIKYLANLW